jgi:hypothetical protein
LVAVVVNKNPVFTSKSGKKTNRKTPPDGVRLAICLRPNIYVLNPIWLALPENYIFPDILQLLWANLVYN